MTIIEQYSTVRVVRLLRSTADYNGWGVNKRNPQVGDTGVVVDILQAANLPTRFVVESSAKDGTTIWLDDFDVTELEPVPQMPATSVVQE